MKNPGPASNERPKEQRSPERNGHDLARFFSEELAREAFPPANDLEIQDTPAPAERAPDPQAPAPLRETESGTITSSLPARENSIDLSGPALAAQQIKERELSLLPAEVRELERKLDAFMDCLREAEAELVTPLRMAARAGDLEHLTIDAQIRLFHDRIGDVSASIIGLNALFGDMKKIFKEAHEVSSKTGYDFLDSRLFNVPGSLAGLAGGVLMLTSIIAHPLHYLPHGAGWAYLGLIGHAMAMITAGGIGLYAFGAAKACMYGGAGLYAPDPAEGKALQNERIRSKFESLSYGFLALSQNLARSITALEEQSRDMRGEIADALWRHGSSEQLFELQDELEKAERLRTLDSVAALNLQHEATKLANSPLERGIIYDGFHYCKESLRALSDGIRWLVRKAADWCVNRKAKQQEDTGQASEEAVKPPDAALIRLAGYHGLHIVTGATTGVARFGEILIDSGKDPVKMLTEVVRGMIGIIQIGEKKDDGSDQMLKQLVKVLLAAKQWEKGQYGAMVGEALVNVVTATCFKTTPYIQMAMESLQSHDLTPEKARESVAEERGPVMRNLFQGEKILEGLVGVIAGPANLAKELMMRAGERLERSLLPHGYHLISQLRESGLELTISSAQKTLRRLEEAHPHLAALAQKDSQGVARAVLEGFIQYEENSRSPETLAVLRDLIAYWDNKRNLEGATDKLHAIQHRREVENIDKRLVAVVDADKKVSWPGTLAYLKLQLERRPPKTQATNLLLDRLKDGSIVLLDGQGKLNSLSSEVAAAYLEKSFRVAFEERKALPRVLPNADKARVAMAELVLRADLTPSQERALLALHHVCKDGVEPLDLERTADALLEAGFSCGQLFGSRRDGKPDPRFPGLFRTGLIGNRYFDEDTLAALEENLK